MSTSAARNLRAIGCPHAPPEASGSALVEQLHHDLRTPLTNLVGYVELLLDGVAGPLDPIVRTYLERAAKGADELSEVVEMLLPSGSDAGPRWSRP